LQYGFFDGGEDESDVRCVGCLREAGTVSEEQQVVVGRELTEDRDLNVLD
jgi:16S rRNA C1402 (ribose-2'-O) methylase RsmI